MKKLNSPLIPLLLWSIVTFVGVPFLGNHQLGIGGFYGYLYDGPLTIILALIGIVCMGVMLLFGNQWRHGKRNACWPLLVVSVIPYLVCSIAAVVISTEYKTIVGQGGYGAFQGAVIANNVKFVGALFSLALVLAAVHMLLGRLVQLRAKLDSLGTLDKKLRRVFWIFCVGNVALLGMLIFLLQFSSYGGRIVYIVAAFVLSALGDSYFFIKGWSSARIDEEVIPNSSDWYAITGVVALFGIVMVLAAEIFKVVWSLTYTSTAIWASSPPYRLEVIQSLSPTFEELNTIAILYTTMCLLVAVVGLTRGLKQIPGARIPKYAFVVGVLLPILIGGVALVPISAGVYDDNEALGINRYLSMLTDKQPTRAAVDFGVVNVDVQLAHPTLIFRNGKPILSIEAFYASGESDSAYLKEIRGRHVALIQQNVSTFEGTAPQESSWPTSPHISFNGVADSRSMVFHYFMWIFTQAQVRTVRYIPNSIEPPINGKRPLWFFLPYPDMDLGQNIWIMNREYDRTVSFYNPNSSDRDDVINIDLLSPKDHKAVAKKIVGSPHSDPPVCIVPFSTIKEDRDLEIVLSAGHTVNCRIVAKLDEAQIANVDLEIDVATESKNESKQRGVSFSPPSKQGTSVDKKYSIVPKTDSYQDQTEFKKQFKAAQSLSKQKKWSEAVSAFQKVNARFPNSPNVLGELTWAAYNDENYELVASVGASAVSLNEDDLVKSSTLYNMGRGEQSRGNIQKAVEHYLRSFQLRKNKRVRELLLELDPSKKGIVEKSNDNWRVYNPQGNRFHFQGKMVHPHCVANIIGGFGENSSPGKKVSLLECTNDEPFKKTKNSATFDPEYEYASYTVVANRRNQFLIDVIFGEGGSQTIEVLLVVELQGDTMVLKKEIHQGDRCGQGYIETKRSVYNNKISYSYSLWARELLNLDTFGKTLNTDGCEYMDCLSNTAIDCFSTATVEYDLLTGNKRVVHVTIDGENVDGGNKNHKRTCFTNFLAEYSNKQKIRFTPNQLGDFIKGYASKCLSGSDG